MHGCCLMGWSPVCYNISIFENFFLSGQEKTKRKIRQNGRWHTRVVCKNILCALLFPNTKVSLTRRRLARTILGLGSMRNVCYSKHGSYSTPRTSLIFILQSCLAKGQTACKDDMVWQLNGLILKQPSYCRLIHVKAQRETCYYCCIQKILCLHVYHGQIFTHLSIILQQWRDIREIW